MALRVHILCQNWRDDRIIPRMARALAERWGWTLGATMQECEAVYLSAYFETQRLGPWPEVPVGAYFTHREETPRNNAKARLFDATAERVDLRVVTARKYGALVEQHGLTVQARAPLERDRFVVAENARQDAAATTPVVGLSGYTYPNRRKGEDLVRKMLQADVAQRVEWRASGRGWPVPTERYSWEDMPSFYQGLDVLVVPSRVEGIPMPPLEAMACGVSVVVPRDVGLLDELPDVPGIYRYRRGYAAALVAALERAIEERGSIDRERLRAATEPYSLEGWCEDVGRAMMRVCEERPGVETAIVAMAGMVEAADDGHEEQDVPRVIWQDPVEQGTGATRGIYCVAFGGPARESALQMMKSAKKHMPDIPIALCSDRAIGPEDLLIVQPDSDVGGRRAKLRAYELAPAEWKAVLYLDADTEVVAPIYLYWQLIEDGWEFVICKDPHLMDTMHSFERANNKQELADVARKIKTLNALQINGGVWAFGRSERVAAFFHRWREEWERFAQRDQGALIRALYADPLKVWWLGNEWNTFPKYTRDITTAGLMHYPGQARRWEGAIPGRIDSETAWQMVDRFEARRRGAAR